MKNSISQLYFVALQRFKVIQSIKFDAHHPAIIGGVIVLMMVWFGFACLRPLNVNQHQDLTHFAQQQTFPMTREMALNVLKESKPNRYQYFRVLRAAHLEQKNTYEQEQIRVEVRKSITDVY